jgi:hypothetical protein
MSYERHYTELESPIVRSTLAVTFWGAIELLAQRPNSVACSGNDPICLCVL